MTEPPWFAAWEEAVLKGDLASIDPREDLDLVRDVALRGAEAGWDLGPLFRALAEREPLALAEIAIGARAPGGANAVRAALAVIEVLECHLPVGSLYRRLALVAGEASSEVLEVAAARHPAASWLVALSDAVNDGMPGLVALRAAAAHPTFDRTCRAHVTSGHLDALLAVAKETGRAEPAAALLAAGLVDGALRAAIAALETDPGTALSLAARLAGVWGPDPDALFVRLVQRLESAVAAQALRKAVEGACPRTCRLLDTVIPALVRRSPAS
ncbi:MAG: hypothetical protein JXB39_08745 [Deltaproteobacteria bacterium]|nr:hypothetical protein [Deltaproteobacteria bacterium]